MNSCLRNNMNILYLTYQTMCFQDKKYATDKYKDIYTELSIVKAKAERDLGRLRDQLQLAHEALGEPSLEDMERGGYGMKKYKKHSGPCARMILYSYPEPLLLFFFYVCSYGQIRVVQTRIDSLSAQAYVH